MRNNPLKICICSHKEEGVIKNGGKNGNRALCYVF